MLVQSLRHDGIADLRRVDMCITTHECHPHMSSSMMQLLLHTAQDHMSRDIIA